MTHTFPTWVTAAKSPEQLATNRLKYLIGQLAQQVTVKGSIRGLAAHCGVDRTSLHKYIAAGSFPAITATQIERACGRALVCHEHLMHPLEINESAE